MVGRFCFRLTSIALGLFMLGLSGCNISGLAAQALPASTVAASYPGLAKQTVGIMVWADRGIVIDHPSVAADIARGLEDKLRQAAGAGSDEVKKVQWYSTDIILRYQEDHPEAETDPAEKVAARFPVTRLIYVELESFTLHPSEAIDLSRGQGITSLKVVEAGGGNAKIGYQEVNISAIYPPKSPSEGVVGITEDEMYRQTVDAITTQLATRFISHEADAE